MQKNKFRIIIACISILSLTLILCGTSLSLFEFTKQGTTENVVKAGTLSVYFTESTGTGMGINISDAYPVSDSIGKNYLNSDQIFDFTITGENTSNNEIPFEITLEKLENSNLDNNAVKVYLTDITEENQEIEIDEPMLYSDLYDSVFKINNDEKVIYQDKVESNETYNKKFRLRMWLSDSIDFEHGNYDNKTFETIINIHSDDKNGITKIYRCDYEIGHTWDFDYTGGEQEFEVPCDGIYKIETWGAQGGNYASSYRGGYGGYSTGEIELLKNKNIFITVGGAGNYYGFANQRVSGGYNGGGGVTTNNGDSHTPEITGGGATHIAYATGVLSSLSDPTSVIIVSGGGSAASINIALSGVSGSDGGGYIGNGNDARFFNGGGPSTGGTQTSGGTGSGGPSTYSGRGSFGQGSGIGWAGAGGGWYGGGNYGYSSGGGSGYIGNTLLFNKSMYCYNCTESNEESTKTVSTTCHSSTPTENCAKEGNGYARITFVSLD